MIGGRARKIAQKDEGAATAGTGQANSRHRRRRSARGVLWIIAMMLASSGALRFGGETGRAIAGELAAGEKAEPMLHEASCKTDDDIGMLLALLKEREDKVAVREMELDGRAQALAVAKEQIAKNLAALEKAETTLEATMALASTAAEEDLVRLTSVYENMKPKEAAALFAAMDPQFAAGFLGRMRADSAATIMAGLDPETAYTISVLLAGRNAEVPTE